MAVDVLKDAVHTSKFDPVEICDAFKSFEQKKTKFKDIGEIIGNTPGGKYFQLQFVSGMENTKKDGKRGGYRFPLVAVQHFDNGKITNGVYLGHVASVQFHGTYETKGSALIFTFKELQFKVGPANFTFPVGSGKNAEGRFIFFYADEDIIVARGQSGGTAFWKRLASSDLLKLGVI